MRLIGLAERALERMCRRTEARAEIAMIKVAAPNTACRVIDWAMQAMTRTAFGARISDQSVTQERIAEARIMIEQARLLTLKAAWMMDNRGNKAFGGAGVTDDYGLAYAYATARVLRLADGPDEVHRNQIARLELRKYQGPASLSGGSAEVLPPDTSPGLHQRPVWIV
jgi:acyl-CoA dehydrogenase